MRFALPLVLLLAGSVTSASQVWLKQPFETWTSAQVRRVLSESPWAGKVSLRISAQGAQVPTRVRAPLTTPEALTGYVVWSSAPPVRYAEWRRLNLKATSVPAFDRASLDATPPSYVLTVLLTHRERLRMLVQTAPIAYQTTALRQGKTVVQASGGRYGLVNASGSIEWQTGTPATRPRCHAMSKWTSNPDFWASPTSSDVPNVPVGFDHPSDEPLCDATTFAMEFEFPRTGALRADGGDIEFRSVINNLTMTRTFNADAMVFEGRPAF